VEGDTINIMLIEMFNLHSSRKLEIGSWRVTVDSEGLKGIEG